MNYVFRNFYSGISNSQHTLITEILLLVWSSTKLGVLNCVLLHKYTADEFGLKNCVKISMHYDEWITSIDDIIRKNGEPIKWDS